MNQVRKFRIAVCGATGAVGREMVKVLAERDFPVANLTLLASERSAGERMTFGGREFSVEVLNNRSFAGVDLALFSAGGAVSKTYAPIAAEAGCVVIDNTSAFRMDPEIPLVVPEVNPQALDDFSKKSIIANPNCSTIQLVVVLKPIEDAVGLKRVVVSTYQAVSGVGKAGVNELEAQCLSLFNMQPLVCNKFERQIAFNCLPHIGDFAEDGYTFEEHKLIDETRKILGKPGLRVTATTVRVPVFYSHSEAVNIETEKKLSADQARKLLDNAPGVRLMDSPEELVYPTALDATGGDDTLVGRIR
ncbi:MAG: aspartate-semialdehyde dehydrogenase, partial [Deltaproteobacteria bacterium]|nr:aspartate-semialdehyde dehydrogenase [Deltaproteobacteria bacterium]